MTNNFELWRRLNRSAEMHYSQLALMPAAAGKRAPPVRNLDNGLVLFFHIGLGFRLPAREWRALLEPSRANDEQMVDLPIEPQEDL